MKKTVHSTQNNFGGLFTSFIRAFVFLLFYSLAFTLNTNAQDNLKVQGNAAKQVKPVTVKIIAPVKVSTDKVVAVRSLVAIKATPVRLTKIKPLVPATGLKSYVSCDGKVLDATHPVIRLISPAEEVENTAKAKDKIF